MIEDGSWNQGCESYAMRRGRARQNAAKIHMTQKMSTKVAPSYDAQTRWFAYEDASDDWRDSWRPRNVDHRVGIG